MFSILPKKNFPHLLILLSANAINFDGPKLLLFGKEFEDDRHSYRIHVKPKTLKFDKSLSNNKILDQSKFKAFADDKINITLKLKFV